MKLVLVNEVLPEKDFQIMLLGQQYHTNLVQQYWPKMFDSISAESWLNPNKPYIPTGADGVVYLTERKVHPNARVRGYHTEESGMPVAYCSLRRAGRTFGIYHPPFMHTNIFTHKTNMISGERFVTGLALTIAHEVAEIIADPHVKTLSAVDGFNRKWLVEIADHCAGSYLVFTDPTTKTNVVLPDVTTPNFYSLTGTTPFTMKNAVSSPFTLTPHGYGFYEVSPGVLKPL